MDGKLAAWRGERAGWRRALDAALAQRPDLALGDALWVHASSAGEFLQARALLNALRAERPGLPLVYTYTSPSARVLLEGFHGADLVFPLPLDTRGNVRFWLDRVRPAALALVDAELWPNTVEETASRGIPVALVSARLAPDAARARWPLRGLYARAYGRLTLAACADERSADALRRSGVVPARLHVAGDLRVDETLRRARDGAPPELPLPSLLPVLVAGSTWPADEAVLLPALEDLRDRGVLLAAAIAPHEVEERRVDRLERRLEEHGFTPARWSRLVAPGDVAPALPSRAAAAAADRGGDLGPAAGALRFGGAIGPAPRLEEAQAALVDAVIVDRVGLLHRLYARSRAAYVGGAFRGRVHNLMEPAAHGVPVVAGPGTGRSWIARELTRACALFPVADRESCVAVLGHFLGDAAAARAAGQRGAEVLERHAGAARRTVEALAEAGWLPQTPAVAVESRR